MDLSFVGRAYNVTKLALKAKAPTLMVAGGITSMGVGTVLAARKTLHVDAVLEPHVHDLERIQKGQELNLPSYGKDVAMSDRFKVYSRVGLDLGKLYFVPGVLWIGGAAMVFGGHRIMLKRNAALGVALSTLANAYDNYRARVRATMGDDFDQAMLSGHKPYLQTDEEGRTYQAGVTRDWDGDQIDPYNRIFQQGESSAWEPDLGVNKMFVHQQQKFAQQKLNWAGVLWLSDVYEALGFAVSDISRVVGWKVEYLPDGTKNIPTVDFGLDSPLPDDWKYSKDNAIYLDFNCKMIVGGKVQKILEAAK